MGLNIKNEETCRLASELARLMGETKTGAITQALRERLERESRLRGSAEIATAPVTVAQLEAVRDAWRRYGKGNHPAALNFGDCFAYALARTTSEPLLFKGNDFARTDIAAA